MDVLFMNCSVYAIPSSQRVGAIVHDGAVDLRLFPGPGADRELDAAFGDGLTRALKVERDKLKDGKLGVGQATRVHNGRLHCDFLLWLATRPEERTERAPAPSVNALHEAVIHALTFVAERSVARVAFPALGDGPGALDGEARLATIVRAAHAYAEQCFVSGRAAVVEEVVVCEPNARVLGAAKRLVSGLAKTSTPVADAGLGAAARAPGATKKRATTTATRSRRKGSAKPTLSEDEIGAARATATAYDMSHRYATGDRFIHPKFGVGRVVNVTQENAIEVVFEDRSVRKMVHARG